VSHPSLGLPPGDQRFVFADEAATIHDRAAVLAARALEVAIERDPTLRARNDEAGLRARLWDATLLAQRLAIAVRQDDPLPMREYAEQIGPVYRRKGVPLDDLVHLCEGLRASLGGVIAGEAFDAASLALDEAIAVLRWHRRLAGDARKKNAFLQFLYKGG
jgi:hypothetical protein